MIHFQVHQDNHGFHFFMKINHQTNLLLLVILFLKLAKGQGPTVFKCWKVLFISMHARVTMSDVVCENQCHLDLFGCDTPTLSGYAYPQSARINATSNQRSPWDTPEEAAGFSFSLTTVTVRKYRWIQDESSESQLLFGAMYLIC